MKVSATRHRLPPLCGHEGVPGTPCRRTCALCVNELRKVKMKSWKCETKKFRYAPRIVDEIETRKKASSQLYSIKSKIRYSETTWKILKKHVS